jgi:hypothetical protein
MSMASVEETYEREHLFKIYLFKVLGLDRRREQLHSQGVCEECLWRFRFLDLSQIFSDRLRQECLFRCGDVLGEPNTHSPGFEGLLMLQLFRERKLGVFTNGLPNAFALGSCIAKEIRSFWVVLTLAMDDRPKRLQFSVGG